MNVKEAIKQTLIIWDEEKYEDYFPNMNLLFKIREEIYEDRYNNESQKQIDIFGTDEDFDDIDDCNYIIDEQQITKIQLFDTRIWKPNKYIYCGIKISDNLKKRIKKGKYKYINEFDHWISYLIVKYYYDPNATIRIKHNGFTEIWKKVSCVVPTL